MRPLKPHLIFSVRPLRRWRWSGINTAYKRAGCSYEAFAYSSVITDEGLLGPQTPLDTHFFFVLLFYFTRLATHDFSAFNSLFRLLASLLELGKTFQEASLDVDDGSKPTMGVLSQESGRASADMTEIPV